MIGKLKIIMKNRYICYLKKSGMQIGNNCEISKNVIFGNEPYLITIGDNVRITNGCRFFCHDGSVWVLRNLGMVDRCADKILPIKVGNNVNFGWNVMVLPGVTIGDNVIIGAGSIITRDIPSNSVAAGVPAKVIKSLDDYYKKVNNDLVLTKHMNNSDKKKYLLSKFGDNLYEK